MKQQLEPLFTPWKIGNCEIKNRIVLTSMGGTNLLGWMEVNHFDKDGAKFILEVAKNNCGLVLPGCQPVYNPMYGQWLYKKKKMYEDLAKWMPEFHKTGAKLFVQLTAGFGRSFTISEMMETLYTNKALRVLAKPFMDLDKITAAPSPSPNRWSDKVPSREMTVEYHRDGADSWLLLDGRLKVVPEQAEKVHAESVGGVSLDMPMMQLLYLYGAPAEYLEEAATKELCGVESYAWYYRNEGWLVTFDRSSSTVDRIFLFPGSSKFLDRAVLNCDSPLERFEGLYGLGRCPKAGDSFHLGQQEYLSFAGYPAYICLSIYNGQ